MMEDDMKRNGSGYYDETPVKTGLFSNTPQAGEIWESTMGKEFLILKNHGGFCTTLALNDNPHEKTIEVVSRTVRYTNPSMVGYSFNNCLSAFIKTVPDEKYLDIMQAVGERLGVTIKVSKADDADEVPNDYITENINLAAELEGFKHRCKALETELKDNKDAQLVSCEMIKQERESKEIAQDAAERMRAACREAEEKASLYEKMYNALLDRLFARGEAK